MNYAKKFIQFAAVMAVLATRVNALDPKELSTQVMADVRIVLSSPTAKKALEAVQAQALADLFNRNRSHRALMVFYTQNPGIFAKWSHIYADFAQEILRTMSLGEILENFGITPSTLGVVTTTTQRSPESKADEEAKDVVITGIFQKGKNAITSLISFGIGSIVAIADMVRNQAQSLIKKDASNTAPTPEELLQLALRTALKKNLTLTELKALYAFSQTQAFEVIVEIAPTLQSKFLEILLSDAEIADKLMTYYRMAMSMTTANKELEQVVATAAA